MDLDLLVFSVGFMEARFGDGAHRFYAMSAADFRAVGKRTMEWDLNDWKWDGDLFIARPLNAVPTDGVGQQFFPLGSGVHGTGASSNSSSSCSDEVNLGADNGKRELEKRRRVTVVEDDNLNNDEPRSLTLKLGGQDFHVPEREVGGTCGNKTKFAGGTSNRAVCQVDHCGADLSSAKDYHRRHKVCEMHSKAGKALVGNVMQRFCQQCSRFHVLQEFDEGKRSCRRRLAGHNKRRRKTNPDGVVNGSALNDDQTSSYLLISILRILSSMHSNRSDQTTDQDLLSHLLKSLASQAGEPGEKNAPGILREPPNLLNAGTALGNSDLVSTLLSNGFQGPSGPFKQLPGPEMPGQGLGVDDARDGEIQTMSSSKPCILNSPPAYSEVRDCTVGQIKMNNFDLNDIYIDSDDGMDDAERSTAPPTVGTSSHSDSHQSSPPQTSGHSDSVSAQSPSSSSGDAQSRTDRIVFKLFGKEPNDFPLVLRAQILDWLSHSPTDIESYIRPGCVILTIYLRQSDTTWEELCSDLKSSLNRLLDFSDDSFWRTGWIYIRVQHQIAFVYDGQVVVDTSLPLRSNSYSEILSIKPIAISASERTQFLIRGINLNRPATRLLCALEGSYLVEENVYDSAEKLDISEGHDELQCINFSCSIPEVNGRGFIEIEDDGCSSSFFPFIVAEEDVCSEIRALESTLDLTETDADSGGSEAMEAKNQALDFINEIGWLLHRSQLKSRLGQLDPNADLFPFKRFKWIMEFSMDHDWCAVVRKLLDILLDGTVDKGEHPSLNLALLEMGLLHRAVRRNSRALVDIFLRYQVSDKLGSGNKAVAGAANGNFLFRPDVMGPGGLTPLHIAAGKDGSENVLDALTDDPEMVGIEAWKSARDSTGSTPEDYARLRGHYSYIHLVQRKIKRSATGHVVLDIPSVASDSSANQKQNDGLTTSFEIGGAQSAQIQQNCKVCAQKLTYGLRGRSMVYRPVMLSMLAVAVVCVCVALLFKSSPEVMYVFRPFNWELLEYGTS